MRMVIITTSCLLVGISVGFMVEKLLLASWPWWAFGLTSVPLFGLLALGVYFESKRDEKRQKSLESLLAKVLSEVQDRHPRQRVQIAGKGSAALTSDPATLSVVPPADPAAGSGRDSAMFSLSAEVAPLFYDGCGHRVAKSILDAGDLVDARRIHKEFANAPARTDQCAPPCALARVLFEQSRRIKDEGEVEDLAIEAGYLLANAQSLAKRRGERDEFDRAYDEFFLGAEDGG